MTRSRKRHSEAIDDIALNDPCINCDMEAECKRNKLACRQFDSYSCTGRVAPSMVGAMKNPNHKIYARLFPNVKA